MTIFIGDTETNGLLDEVTKFHCLCFSPVDKDIFYVFCNSEELVDIERFTAQNIQFFPLDDYLKFINSPKTTGIIIHNLFGYDLQVMEKLSGIEYDYKSINRRELFLGDSLVMSRNLFPDRFPVKGAGKTGPHSLNSWGIRLGIIKPQVMDWSDQILDVYVNRVIEDVKINKVTYFTLLEDMKDLAISNGDKKGSWGLPLKMAHKVAYLMEEQQKTGVKFDVKAAEKLVIRIDKEMKEIEEEVEPKLGERYLPKGQQPQPPKQPWKKAFDYKNPYTQKGLKKSVTDYLEKIGYTDSENQEKYIKSMVNCTEVSGHTIVENNINDLLTKHKSLLSSSATSYCKKIGIEDEEDMFNEMIRLDKKGEVVVRLKEKLRLKHKKDVKEALVKEGWVPTMWKPRNICINQKTKQNLTKEEINIKLDKYLSEFYQSIYWPFIYKELGYKREPLDITTDIFRKKCIKKGRNLPSSPLYKDQRGVRCTNLKKLTGKTSKLIIKWLSLQNRRNTIESLPSKTKKAYTGWLHHPRLKIDERLPASYSGITPTFRKRHSIVVNVPKPSSTVVLGKEMRGLFITPDDYYNVGGDGKSIEAMVASHYTIPFDNGKYAKGVLSGSFHDDNAASYSKISGNNIDRSQGKNFTYMILYGGSGKKAAVMASVPKKKGDEIVDGFWDVNPGLKAVKEALEIYWNATGKKYIYGLDGRRVYTRSRHSLVNTLFQHASALILDFAQCYVYDKIKQHKLDVHRWGEFHDESQAYEHKSEIKILVFDEEPKQERNGVLYSKPKEVDGKWIQYYAPFGHYLDEGFKAASKYFKTNVEFRVEYMVGKSWRDCH